MSRQYTGPCVDHALSIICLGFDLTHSCVCCTGDAVELAAALARQPQTGGAGVVRPPAIVVEYMGQGSLKGALARKADIVQGALIRVLIAMDAAKVGCCACCCHANAAAALLYNKFPCC